MIALTGITGLTGKYVLSFLAESVCSSEMRCLVRPTSRTENLRGLGSEIVVGDCTDRDCMRALVEGTEMLIHVAGIHSAEVVLEVCRDTGVNRVIFVNTTGMFSSYRRYAIDYQRIDGLIAQSSLDYTIIRPTMIFGDERDRNISRLIRIVNSWPVIPVIKQGHALMQPVHARDVGWAIAKASLDDRTVRKAYNIAGRMPLTYADLLGTIAEVLGRRILLLNMPYWAAMIAGKFGEVVSSPLLSVEKIQRLCEDKAFDYSEARNDFGYSPMSFREGVAEEINEMRLKRLL